MRVALTKDDAWALAKDWIAAWNSHDLDRIMHHYADEVELNSPVAAQLLGNSNVRGKTELRAYFQRGLEAYPDLRFELESVLWGTGSVVLYYKNQSATYSAEFMQLSETGKVVRVVAHYAA